MIEIRTPTDGIPCPMCTRAPTASHLLGTSLPEGGYAVCGRGGYIVGWGFAPTVK